jgi:hypothetical protein
VGEIMIGRHGVQDEVQGVGGRCHAFRIRRHNEPTQVPYFMIQIISSYRIA